MTKRKMGIQISSTWCDISTTKTRYTNKRNSVTASVEIVHSMKVFILNLFSVPLKTFACTFEVRGYIKKNDSLSFSPAWRILCNISSLTMNAHLLSVLKVCCHKWCN